jgi:hypothetical protein
MKEKLKSSFNGSSFIILFVVLSVIALYAAGSSFPE